MTNDRATRKESLSAKAAFVVHLTTNEAASGLTGRVEHISSGHSLRFTSVEQLVTFMQRTAGYYGHPESSVQWVQERPRSPRVDVPQGRNPKNQAE